MLLGDDAALAPACGAVVPMGIGEAKLVREGRLAWDAAASAITEANRAIDAELARVSDDRTTSLLGNEAPAAAELTQFEAALHKGRRLNVDIADFVVRAVSLAGGGASGGADC